MTQRSKYLGVGTLLCAMMSAQQSPPPAPPTPLLSPKAAYEDAMHPLDVTRHSVANWSDTEIAALKVTMSRAASACALRKAADLHIDQLVDYARLCALGQNWPAVVEATRLYLSNGNDTKPQAHEAYAAQVDALLHLKNEPAALISAKAMLSTLPYNSLTAETINEALEYMRFLYTEDALALAAARQPDLLTQLQNSAKSPDPDRFSSTTASASLRSTAEIYEDGLALAALQQLAGHSLDQPGKTVSALDAALPPTLPPDMALQIGAVRLRYAMLGLPLKDITKLGVLRYLSMPGKPPTVPATNATTALLAFPDWCAHAFAWGGNFLSLSFR